MTPPEKTVEDLVDEAAKLLREYQEHPRTPILRELAPVIVELRSHFQLRDGRPDWSGRSHGYRQHMSAIFAKAGVSVDDRDRLQSALRWHIGDIVRDRASRDELLSVGLTTVKPKERIQRTRDLFQAMKADTAPRQDVARLTAYAQDLLEHVDAEVIPDLEPERAEDALEALEAIQTRTAELLRRLNATPCPLSEPVESPAELLERAAAKLEELAFGFGAEEFWQKDIARADLSVGAREWAPVMGPAVALPLVALLRSAALAYADYPGLPENLMRSADVAPAYGHTYQLVQDALVLATSILGEQS